MPFPARRRAIRSARSRGISVRLCAASTYRRMASRIVRSLLRVRPGPLHRAGEGPRVPVVSSSDVATREEVDRTLRQLVKRLDGADLDGASLPEHERTIICHVT